MGTNFPCNMGNYGPLRNFCMTSATDFTVLLSFEDRKMSDLVLDVLSRYLPDMTVADHNNIAENSSENAVILTDMPDGIAEGSMYIFFSAENRGSSALHQMPVPFRAGQLIDNLRRLTGPSNHYRPEEEIPVGSYNLSMQDGLLTKGKDHDPLYLTEKERDILYCLYKAAGTPVDRKSLLNYVWQYAENVETHTLETHIYRLRQKIEDNPALPQILLTDENGYRLSM